MTGEPPAWKVHRARGSAAALHARDLEPAGERALWVLDVDAPAIVLGSTQGAVLVDAAAARRAGVAIAHRRSGGGMVHLAPGGALWVDVVIPAGDPLWDPDVSRAFVVVGEAWATALRSLGAVAPEHDLVVHRGPLVRTPWSSLVCFAGLGPGEVVVQARAVGEQGGAPGRKLVGMSQRRTRTCARFQCLVHRRFDPADTVSLLALRPADARDLGAALTVGVATVDVEPGALVAALARALASVEADPQHS